MPLAASELRERIAAEDWYHTIEVGPGLVSDGLFDHRPYVGRYGFPEDMTGLRVLDVGTFDGFWAFELERRGATVTALDVDSSLEYDWPPRLRPERGEERGERFRLVREALGSSVERVSVSVYDATPERLGGTFDLVLCSTVLIHVRDPMLALERMAALCHDRLVFADEYSRRLEWVPFGPTAEFTGESPWMTWWRPTSRGWISMIRCAGFEDVRRHARFKLGFRAQRGGVPLAVIHARGVADRV